MSSLSLPVTLKYPSSNSVPKSPEWSQPFSSIASLVLSSLKRYPIIMFLELMMISPSPSESGLKILVLQPSIEGPEEYKIKSILHKINNFTKKR